MTIQMFNIPGAPTRTIAVTQAAIIRPTLTLSESSWNSTSAANNTTINISSNIVWNTPTSDVNWLTVSDITPANRTGNGFFRMTATANEEGIARDATIRVFVDGAPIQTINVMQAAQQQVALRSNPELFMTAYPQGSV